MPIVNKQSFFSASKPRVSKVRIEALDEEVYIKSLSGMQRAKLQDAVRKKADIQSNESQVREFACPIIAISLVGEDGTRLFSDDDLELIGDMNYPVVQELTNAILKVNGVVSDAVTEAKNVSSPTPSERSTSA